MLLYSEPGVLELWVSWLYSWGSTVLLIIIVFVNRLISRFGDIPWPSRSPDLSVYDVLLWGCLKLKVYQTKVRHLNYLRGGITEEVQVITQPMLERVLNSFFKRLIKCRLVQGHHLRVVIFLMNIWAFWIKWFEISFNIVHDLAVKE